MSLKPIPERQIYDRFDPVCVDFVCPEWSLKSPMRGETRCTDADCRAHDADDDQDADAGRALTGERAQRAAAYDAARHARRMAAYYYDCAQRERRLRAAACDRAHATVVA